MDKKTIETVTMQNPSLVALSLQTPPLSGTVQVPHFLRLSSGRTPPTIKHSFHLTLRGIAINANRTSFGCPRALGHLRLSPLPLRPPTSHNERPPALLMDRHRKRKVEGKGKKMPLSNETLAGFDEMPTEIMKGPSKTFEVYREVTVSILEATSNNYVRDPTNYTRDAKAVLVIVGTPELDPPNFKEMLSSPGVQEVVSSVYGELKGCIVKHLVGSTWGDLNRGGGIYFFTAPEHIDAYLASDQWTDFYSGTPWSKVEYSKYEVVSESK